MTSNHAYGASCLVSLMFLAAGAASPVHAQIGKAMEQAQQVAEKSGGSNNLPPKENRPPQARTRSEKKVSAVDGAIEVLKQEYQGYLKEGSPTPRTESNYFVEHPAEEVTQENILQALGKSIHGNPRVAAYVKWQLLSGISGQFDDKLVDKAVRAYKSAPRPAPRPGIEASQRKALDAMLRGAREGDVGDIDAKLREAVAQGVEMNQPIIAYRDALFAKLPSEPRVFDAAFGDLRDRLMLAAETQGFRDVLLGNVRAWAMSGATPQQMTAMAQYLRKLTSQTGPDYYDQAEWKDSRVQWRTRSVSMDEGRHLSDLMKYLEERARNPDGDLKVQ